MIMTLMVIYKQFINSDKCSESDGCRRTVDMIFH